MEGSKRRQRKRERKEENRESQSNKRATQWDDVDHYHLRITHLRSFEAIQRAKNSSYKLPRHGSHRTTPIFAIHGIYPANIKNGKVNHVVTSSRTKNVMLIPRLPKPPTRERLDPHWRSLNVEVKDREFRKRQTNKHIKFQRYGSLDEFFEKCAEVVEMFLEEGSNLNLSRILREGNFMSGHTYACTDLIDHFSRKLGKIVSVDFMEHDGKLILGEIGILLDKRMELTDNISTKRKYASKEFYLL